MSPYSPCGFWCSKNFSFSFSFQRSQHKLDFLWCTQSLLSGQIFRLGLPFVQAQLRSGPSIVLRPGSSHEDRHDLRTGYWYRVVHHYIPVAATTHGGNPADYATLCHRGGPRMTRRHRTLNTTPPRGADTTGPQRMDDTDTR